MVHKEHQRQGATNVTVRNIITSMRLISDVNWPEFFEDVSLVDAALRAASDLASMDFATRNLYRSAIEALSRRSLHTRARNNACTDRRHLGSQRFGSGCDPQARPGISPARTRASRVRTRHWLSRAAEQLAPASSTNLSDPPATSPRSSQSQRSFLLFRSLRCSCWKLRHVIWWCVRCFGLIPAIDVAVALVNRAVMRGFGATMLPGLALRDGVPASMRTMIVVPMLLTTREALETQLERLEVHYLASSDGELHFALLSDWTDAATRKHARR